MKSFYLIGAFTTLALLALAVGPAVACDGYADVGGGAFSIVQPQAFVQPVYAQQFAVRQPVYGRAFRQRVVVQPFRQRVIVRERVRSPFLQLNVGGY